MDPSQIAKQRDPMFNGDDPNAYENNSLAGRVKAILIDPSTGAGYSATPGSGAVISQGTGTITLVSQSLTAVPAGANWVRLQLHGAGMSVRYDGVAASGSASEELDQDGGAIVLESASDIAGFRYVGLLGATGNFSAVYRKN
jgi:hypothetical protein